MFYLYYCVDFSKMDLTLDQIRKAVVMALADVDRYEVVDLELDLLETETSSIHPFLEYVQKAKPAIIDHLVNQIYIQFIEERLEDKNLTVLAIDGKQYVFAGGHHSVYDSENSTVRLIKTIHNYNIDKCIEQVYNRNVAF